MPYMDDATQDAAQGVLLDAALTTPEMITGYTDRELAEFTARNIAVMARAMVDVHMLAKDISGQVQPLIDKIGPMFGFMG